MTLHNYETVVNPSLLSAAKSALRRIVKLGFVPGGDPAMAGMDPAAMGGDPAAAGMDPAAVGGDPAATGMDPAAMGGAPAAPPAGDPAMLAKMDQILQMLQAGGGGGSGGAAATPGAGQIKPKIDQNVLQLQQTKLLARICDHLGISIPASEMIATPADLTGMAQQQTAGVDPVAAAAQSVQGAAGGMPGMPGAEAGLPGAKTAGLPRNYHVDGTGQDAPDMQRCIDKAAAVARIRKARRSV